MGPESAPGTSRPRSEALMPAAPAGPTVWLTCLPAVLAVLVVAEQIAYPLLSGRARDAATVAIVVTLALACVAHAAVTRGAAVAAALLALTAVPGFALEVLGVHSGFPFGHYAYSTTLGPRWGGVPVVIGLAWTMLAWPAVLAARALVRSPVARVLVGGWALASADLFLDPQMVDRGYWTWRDPTPHLPGVGRVPLTNFAGWLLVSLVIAAAVQALLRRDDQLLLRRGRRDDLVPRLLYLWLYVGWIVALAVFGDLPAAAGWGALGMGPVAIPLAARHVRTGRR